MVSKTIVLAAGALSALQPALAQTFTDCNPMDKKCPDNPALGTSLTIDWTKGPSDFFEIAAGTTIDKYDPELGAVFSIEKETHAPTVSSKKYIFFGSVSVVTRAAPGTGIVSSIVLQSANLDEIDWEWLGGERAQVQTNYFGKGDTTTYDRGAYHTVANPQDVFYNYTIDWTPDYLRWYIDGAMVREVTYAAAKGGYLFPQSPCQLKLGSWVGGKAVNGPDTVKWAGGLTDFSQAPFNAYYKSITITDYHKGASSYVWPPVPAGARGDGKWQGIKVVYGGGSDSSSSNSSSSSAASSSASATLTSSSNNATSTAATATSTSVEATSSSIVASTTGGGVVTGDPNRILNAPAATSTTPTRNSGTVLGQDLITGVLFAMGAVFFSFAL